MFYIGQELQVGLYSSLVVIKLTLFSFLLFFVMNMNDECCDHIYNYDNYYIDGFDNYNI